MICSPVFSIKSLLFISLETQNVASGERLGNDPAPSFHRFCDLVNSITEEAWRGPEEGDCDSETLEVGLCPLLNPGWLSGSHLSRRFSPQYDYEYDEHGERVVLGKGTFGVVYAGRDLSNQVRLAIKEIPERDSR